MSQSRQALSLHYQERGEGPAVVMLHGLYGSGQNWGRHARRLAQRFRVITPDLRNHGHSPHDPAMTYPAMAADVAALLDRLKLEQAALVGHSLGGKVAMTLALDEPGRVARLCVADMAPVGYGDHGHDAIITALQGLNTASLASRAEADRALADAIPERMVRQFLLTNLEGDSGGYRWRIPLDILRRALPDIGAFPATETQQYPGPALFVYGGRSDYVTEAGEAAIRAHFPNAELRCLEPAGHWLHVETPEAFAEALDAFLGD